MKKLSLIVAGAVIAGFVGFAGTASADPAPNGNAFGAYGCYSAGDGFQKNPGQLFKAIRARTGYNPAEISLLAGFESTGDYIANRCGEENLPSPD